MNRAQFVKAVRTDRIDCIEVRGLGTVHVKPMPLRARGAVIKAGERGDHAEALLLAVAGSLCDDEGRPLFDWRDPRDLDALDRMELDPLNEVAEAALRASGMTNDEVEAIEGNSEGASGDSCSGSPSPSVEPSQS